MRPKNPEAASKLDDKGMVAMESPQSASPRSPRHRQLCGWKVVGLTLCFLAAAQAYSQTYQAEVLDSTGAQVQDDGTVYITPSDQNNYPMPELQIDFTNNASCTANISATLTVLWVDTDPSGSPPNGCNKPAFETDGTTSENLSVPANSGSSWNLAPTWDTNVADGGTATLTWSVNGVQQTSYSFNILMKNPSESEVDVDYSGAPWFYGSMIRLESGGNQANSSYLPYVINNPDGIGLGQVDGCQNTPTDGTYWNHNSNIQNSISVLNGKASESQTEWLLDYGNSGDVSPAPSDTKNPYPYCDFVTNTQALSSSNHSFGEADWIQDYNTHSNQHWYLWWSSAGTWVFKYQTSDPGNYYVPDVCDDASY